MIITAGKEYIPPVSANPMKTFTNIHMHKRNNKVVFTGFFK